MKLRDLIARLQSIQDEIGGDVNSAHPGLDWDVHVCFDGDGDDDIELVDVEPQTAVGCGCYISATLVVRKS